MQGTQRDCLGKKFPGPDRQLQVVPIRSTCNLISMFPIVLKIYAGTPPYSRPPLGRFSETTEVPDVAKGQGLASKGIKYPSRTGFIPSSFQSSKSTLFFARKQRRKTGRCKQLLLNRKNE